jgi:hypothetical protein
MENKHQSPQQPSSQGSGEIQAGKESDQEKKKISANDMEDPAAESEIGPNIYDLGMGGPDASSSGIRTREDDEREEE